MQPDLLIHAGEQRGDSFLSETARALSSKSAGPPIISEDDRSINVKLGKPLIARDAAEMSDDEDAPHDASHELMRREARVVDARLALDHAHKKVSRCRDIYIRRTGKIDEKRQAATRLKQAEEEVIMARSVRNDAERKLAELKPRVPQSQSSTTKRTKQISLTGEAHEGRSLVR